MKPGRTLPPSLLLVSLLLALSAGGCSAPPYGSETPEKEDPFARRIEEALDLAGDNRPEIEAFLAAYPEGEKRTAARFLAANMPAGDLASVTAEALSENLDLAFRARGEMPWGRKPPFNDFLHYVLPYRVTQEPFTRWRPRFFEALRPLLSGCRNMEEAALLVNRWCEARIKFKQTEFRDQSPEATLRSRYGRCEEMMILYICAARSVGLPARPCSTPWWTFCDNNHAWVEVWADGAWHYAGGSQSAPRLDEAWFSRSAERAGMVRSIMFGTPEGAPTKDVIYAVKGKAALINSTAVYACTGVLEIEVLEPGGAPAARCPVSVSVCNYQALRSVAHLETGASGTASIELGVGGFFLSAGDGRGRAYAVVQVPAGKTLPVTLRLDPAAVPPAAFWLRLPTPAEAARMKAARDAAQGRTRPKGPPPELPPLPPPPPLDRWAEGALPELDAALAADPSLAPLEGILEDACAHWRVIARGVLDLPPERRGDAVAFLRRTTHLDRLEITAATIRDHVLAAAEARARNHGSADLPEEGLYLDYVLKAGIDREHLAPWRRRLQRAFSACKGKDAADTTRAVMERVERRVRDRAWDFLCPEMNPLQTWSSGHGLASEKAVLAVAALRALGVPARKAANRNVVEFHDGERWREYAPEKETPGGKPLPASTKKGRIVVRARREGKPLSGFRDFEVSTFSNGGWVPLRTLTVTTEGERSIAALPPGEYLVTTKVRNGNGDPFVRTRQAALEAGGEVCIDWDVDLPPDAGLFTFEKVRSLEAMPAVTLRDGAGRALDLRAAAEKGPLLLFFFTAGDEPSERMFPLVQQAARRLREEAGVRALALLLPRPGENGPASPFPSTGTFPLFPVGEDTGRAFGLPFDERAGRFERLPSVLLTSTGGEVVLWKEGYDLEIGRLLESAARVVR